MVVRCRAAMSLANGSKLPTMLDNRSEQAESRNIMVLDADGHPFAGNLLALKRPALATVVLEKIASKLALRLFVFR